MDSSIFLSDDEIFHLIYQVNRHNICYWSHNNPQRMRIIWCELESGRWKLLVHLFNDNVTGETYFEFLHEFLFDYLEDISIHHQQNFFFSKMKLQHILQLENPISSTRPFLTDELDEVG